jgi:uncharacterized small protein (DUF1192 family)
MYGNEIMKSRAYEQQVADARDNEITVVENLDLRIKSLREEVERLEAAKERLSTSGLLNVRIHDLRIATNY